MATKFKGVTILLPVMDETYSLRETVRIIHDSCKQEDLEEFIIIMCERTSPDSRKVAEDLIREYGKYHRISVHDQKLPYVGGAIREGIMLAKGSHVVMMSSDLETDPLLIKEFVILAKKYPRRIITASRWKRGGGFEGYNKIKLICNLIFERSIALFYFVRLTDITYAYRIFPTRLMQRIRWEELKHPFFLETALKPIRLGIKFVEIPAKWKARTEGISRNGFFDNFKYFRTAWKCRFMKKNNILNR